MASFWEEYSQYVAYFGLAAATYLLLKVTFSCVYFIRNYILARPLQLGKNLKAMGQWAVVTGATDGIGKAYAEELAAKGMDIVLVSRNPDKLSDVAAEIESQYKVKTKKIAADFTRLDIYDNIRKQLTGMNIGVLVNNVGMSYEYPEYFHNVDQQMVERLVTVNCHSVAQMTHIVLPGMVERKSGAILNISSASACKPTPLLTLYSATKVFVDTFSRALQTEVADKKIIVQSVMPSFVATKLSKVRRESFMIPGPTSYVRSALSTVGLQDRTYGCLSHGLQGLLFDTVPDCLFQFLVPKFFTRAAAQLKERERRHRLRQEAAKCQ